MKITIQTSLGSSFLAVNSPIQIYLKTAFKIQILLNAKPPMWIYLWFPVQKAELLSICI